MKRKLPSLTLIYFVLICGVVVFALPYLYMIISSTQTNEVILGTTLNFKFGPHFGANIGEVQEKYDYVRVLMNTSNYYNCRNGYLNVHHNISGICYG
ncbi:hypothetical protein MGH68_01005 [Erysipelothrix sp. D19-032]